MYMCYILGISYIINATLGTSQIKLHRGQIGVVIFFNELYISFHIFVPNPLNMLLSCYHFQVCAIVSMRCYPSITFREKYRVKSDMRRRYPAVDWVQTVVQSTFFRWFMTIVPKLHLLE